MGLGQLRRRSEQPEQRAFWSVPGGYGYSTSAADGSSNLDQAMRNAAAWACMNVLADAIGRAPIDVFRGSGSSKAQVTPTPQVVARPSGMVLPDVWRFQLGWSLVSDGNAFGRITHLDRAGWPTNIELLDPCAVSERKVVDGVPQVKIDNKDVHRLHPFGDIWHVPGRTVPAGSPFALSPVEQASAVVGTSLAAEQFSQRYFTGGGHPSSIIYADAALSPDEASAIKDAWRRATSGYSREPAVLGNGLKLEKIQTDPGETQFIELIRVMVDQVCRFWGVPPSMVYGAISGQSVTYANITDYDLSFLKHSLDGYYVRVENGLTDILPRPQVAKVNRNSMLRADIKARFDAYAIGIAGGWLTINEVRGFEDYPAFGPAYDVPGPIPAALPPPAPPLALPPGGAT